MVTEKKKSPSSSEDNVKKASKHCSQKEQNVSSKNAQESVGPQSQELAIFIGPELQKNDDTGSDEGSAEKNEETEDIGEFETTDSSFDALEKCIEWLSFHPTDYNSNAHHNHNLQEVTKKKLVEYRQKAVQQWIDTLPDSSASSLGGSVKEIEDKDANGNAPNVPLLRPTSLHISGGSALERKPSLTRLATVVAGTTERTEVNWIERFPLIGRCCQRLSYLMGRFQIYENSRAPVTRDEGKVKLEHVENEQAIIDSMISEIFPPELSSGEAGPRTSQDVRREANFRRTIDRNYAEEIQRLTTLLSNAPKPKSRTRTIFSLRKERILPEAQSAPGVIHRMGRHVQEFFSSRLNRNRNRGNRVNPSSQENERTTAAASQNQTESAKRSTFASIKNFFFSPNRTSASEQFQ